MFAPHAVSRLNVNQIINPKITQNNLSFNFNFK